MASICQNGWCHCEFAYICTYFVLLCATLYVFFSLFFFIFCTFQNNQHSSALTWVSSCSDEKKYFQWNAQTSRVWNNKNRNEKSTQLATRSHWHWFAKFEQYILTRDEKSKWSTMSGELQSKMICSHYKISNLWNEKLLEKKGDVFFRNSIFFCSFRRIFCRALNYIMKLIGSIWSFPGGALHVPYTVRFFLCQPTNPINVQRESEKNGIILFIYVL